MTLVATGHDRRQLLEALAERLASREICLPSDQHDMINTWVGLEELKRALEDGSPVDLHEHLVDGSTHSRPLPSGHDDGGGPHRTGSARTRTRAAWQSPIMSLTSASPPAIRARASARASRSKAHGPMTCTTVSRGTVRRTLPSTTSLTVSLIGRVTTPGASPAVPSAPTLSCAGEGG